jgi:hypothetical protein
MGKSKTEYTYLQDYIMNKYDLNEENIIQAEGLIYQTLNCDTRVKDIE